ncbi:hypothetical protein KJ644_01800, partial [Candidatus Dependentiae bacterium]|nr:hypothetical protein [Candidatus Dependentiae bacterium]MBU4387185.1 hypothetical protein [Candidatus Dependentiae bacterium]MCG2756000.1 hypothetical protein [Candidatus Dependentiae bacterium]
MKKLKIFLVLILVYCNIFSMSDVGENPEVNKDPELVILRRSQTRKLSDILKERDLDKKSKKRIEQLLGEDISEQPEIDRVLNILFGE